MQAKVEGKWKDFTFKSVQDNNYDEILAHLRSNFYRDEPLNYVLGDSPAKDEDFDTMALHYLKKYHLSFFAMDNETQRVAGVTIMNTKEKGTDMSELISQMKSSEVHEKLLPFITALQKEIKIFDIYTDIDHYAHLPVISVDKDYRGKGLASEMMDRAIAMVRAEGFRLLDAVFTSPHTRKIGVAKGFKELAGKFFRDFRNDNGDIVLSGATDEDFASWQVLEL